MTGQKAGDPLLSEKARRRILVSAILVLAFLVAMFLALYPFYGTFGWFIEPPPKLYIGGTGYSLYSTSPSASLPPTVAWIADHHMWPLWYDIFTPQGEAGPSIFLRWRDGMFYTYTTRG